MTSKLRWILVVLAIMIWFTGICSAGETNIDLGVNTRDIDARVVYQFDPDRVPLALGTGLLYSDKEDYWITHLRAGVQDEVFVPGLDLGLGFKGVFGAVDIAGEDYKMLGLAFQFLAGYDFRQISKVPISIIADFAYAPSILSGQDMDSYLEFYTAAFVHLNEWASVFVGFRDLNVDFKDGGIDLKDDAFYFGARLTF